MNLKLNNILPILICGFYGFAQNNTELNSVKDCSESKVYLKTETQEKPKRILFFKTQLKKIKTIDRVLDSKSNILLKRVSKSIEHGDVLKSKTFNRIIIENDKITKYRIPKNSDYGKAVIYNKCGKKIGEKELATDSIINKFVFK